MLRYTQTLSAPQPAAQKFEGLFSILGELTLRPAGALQIPDWLHRAVSEGKPEAQTHLAALRLAHGQRAQAEGLFDRAASQGYVLAQKHKAVMHLFGIGGPADLQAAIGPMRDAAEGGSVEACELLGLLLAKKDPIQARHWLERSGNSPASACLTASDLGLMPEVAEFFLGVFRLMSDLLQTMPSDTGDAELQRALVVRAKAGDGVACLMLATVATDDGIAHWLCRAAEAGQELAILALGFLALAGHGNIRQTLPLQTWLQGATSSLAIGLRALMAGTEPKLMDQAAVALGPDSPLGKLFVLREGWGMASATFRILGTLLARQIEGKEEMSPFTVAVQMAEAGDAGAQAFVGMGHFTGHGVEKDPEAAFPWLLKAAEQGVLLAQSTVAIAYADGQGAERDVVQAAHWFDRAAQQGVVTAQQSLAFGPFGETGLSWLRKLAEEGDLTAQKGLAHRLFKGQGMEADPAEAVSWLRKVAEAGDLSAQFVLACRYLSGQDVAEDEAEALAWFLKAAAQGDADAQYHAGMLLLDNEAQDDIRAGFELLFEAAKQGQPEAKDFLDRMAANRSPKTP